VSHRAITTLVVTIAFAITGFTAVLADDDFPEVTTITNYDSAVPVIKPGENIPENMDFYPLGPSGETFDLDLGLFYEKDNVSKPTANDWVWDGTDGNPAGSAYHPGLGAYDTVVLEDYLISSCCPTQFKGTYDVSFDYQGVGFVNVYYTWEDPVTTWPGGTNQWYYMATFGNAGVWTNTGALPIPTGLDECNCFFLIFEAYGNAYGEDIAIDNVLVTYTFTGMDVDVTALVKPDPNMGQQVAPPEVWIEVSNVGTIVPVDLATGDPKIDLHLQIYEEIDYQPEIDNCNDFEAECCDEWPFYAVDGDGDGMTWTRTDRRSHSPTHSWRVTPCDRAVYAGSSNDSLISYWKKIPDWESHVWLNFSCWVQGEITPDAGKLEDYMEVWVQADYDNDGVADTPWGLLKKVGDTGGEWKYIENIEHPDEGLDFTTDNFGESHQDHWLCEKGSGAPKKWWGGIDLTDGWAWYPGYGPVGPIGLAGGESFRVKFVWKSDPCDQFEGAYVDDVCILSLRGQEQPLVYNEYKILHYPLQPGESVLVKFPLVEQYWTPKEDTWYFFEAYSCVGDDVDGLCDNNYTMKFTEKIIPDPWYRDPWNGVNETVYFGNMKDAMVTHVAVDKEFELYVKQCGDVYCKDVPIEVTVFNNGTYTEEIPVVVEIRKKLDVSLFSDDFEDGTIDKWEPHVSADHIWNVVLMHADDWYPANGDYHMAMADERKMYWNDMGGGPFTSEVVYFPTGEFPIWFDFLAMYNLENEGHVSGEVSGTPIYYKTYDAFAPGILNDAQNAFQFWWPTTVANNPADYSKGTADITGATRTTVLTGHTSYNYVNYEKYFDLRPMLDNYNAYGEAIRPGFYFKSDDADNMNENLPLDASWSGTGPDRTSPFGGVMIDDVNIYYVAPGEIVATLTDTVTLDPKEEETLEFTWDACIFCDFFVVGKTMLEGDCNPENDDAQNETYLYHEIFEDDIEEENDYWTTEDNTRVEGSEWEICGDDRCLYEDHVWSVKTEDLEYGMNADEILQLFNPETKDGSFDFTEVDNAIFSFDLWAQIEAGWDHLILEVSNDSGQNWWTIDTYSKIANRLENEEEWQVYTYELFNLSIGQDWIDAYDLHSRTPFSAGAWFNVPYPDPGGYEYYNWDMYEIWYFEQYLGYPQYFFWPGDPLDWMFALGYTMVGLTDEMHLRFHFMSDGSTVYKGPMIDDVYLNTTTNETIVLNGGVHTKTWEWIEEVIFFDDMEDPAVSEEKWIQFDGSPFIHGRRIHGAPVGDKWHRTTHSNFSGEYSWWCADYSPWSSYGTYIDGGFYTLAPVAHTPGTDPFGLNLGGVINEFNWITAVYDPILGAGFGAFAAGPNGVIYFMTAHDHSPLNYRNYVDNKLILNLDLTDKWKGYLTYNLHYNFSDENDYLTVEISNDGGATWQELTRYTNDTNTLPDWVREDGFPAGTPYPRGYHGIKITPWLPGEIMILFRIISNATGTDVGVEIDDVRITGAPDCMAPMTTCILNPPLPDGNEGWYVSNVEVTLTATDDREVAATYYSIDGGSWLEYTAPITVSADGEHTVSYYSVDGVGNTEDAKYCASFKIDKTAPSASLNTPQAGYIYLFGRELMPRILDQSTALIIGGYTATATASDTSSGVDYVRFSTGAGSGEDAVSPYEYNLPFYFPFGSDTLSVSVTDVAGNSANDGSVSYTKIL
jgi:hypothetical protein